MFRLTQHIEFCYGHRLLNYDGKCRFLHGHNGLVEIVLEGDKLDDRGMLVDFTDIKKSLRTWIDQELDHRMILRRDDPIAGYLLEQKEPVVLLDHNPTAENLARMIFQRAEECQFPVVEVTLWETPKAHATYCSGPGRIAR